MTALDDARWMPNNHTLHAIAEQAHLYDDGRHAVRARCGAFMGPRRPVDPSGWPARLCPYCLAALGIDVVARDRRSA